MVLARDIAEKTGIPKPYLSKMLNQLQHAGLVLGKRGYKGGLVLSRPARKLTLYDIVTAVDGDDWCHRCFLGLPNCGGEHPCPMHDFWGVEREKIAETLRGLTLDRIKEFQENGWRLG